MRELWKVFELLDDFGKLMRELKREMLKSQDICKIVRTKKEQKGEFEIQRKDSRLQRERLRESIREI